MTKIFIGNLPPSTSEEDVNKIFRKYGKIEEVDIFKSYGFVHMRKPECAENAVRALHQTLFFGKKINVEFSRNPKMTGRGDDSKQSKRGLSPRRRRGGRKQDERSPPFGGGMPPMLSGRRSPRMLPGPPEFLLDLGRNRDPLGLPPLPPVNFPMPLIDTPLYATAPPIPRDPREADLLRDWYLRGLKILDTMPPDLGRMRDLPSMPAPSRSYEDLVRDFDRMRDLPHGLALPLPPLPVQRKRSSSRDERRRLPSRERERRPSPRAPRPVSRSRSRERVRRRRPVSVSLSPPPHRVPRSPERGRGVMRKGPRSPSSSPPPPKRARSPAYQRTPPLAYRRSPSPIPVHTSAQRPNRRHYR